VSDIEKPPSPDGRDHIHKLVKLGLQAIPGVGPVIAEGLDLVVRPPLGKRLDKWCKSVYEKLKELEESCNSFSMGSLQENEEFITVVLNATQIAVRTHREEKLEALRNAVLNVAMRNAPEEDLQDIFLNLIDRFTPWHLRVLKLFHQPPGSLLAVKASFLGILTNAFPQLKGRRDFCYVLMMDLENNSLVVGTQGGGVDLALTSHLDLPMEPESLRERIKTTEQGEKFLGFITHPSQRDE